jgi:cobalt-zinc-cadmium efflux system protein
LNSALLLAEVIGALVFGSLSLLADGVHMLTDVVGLGIAAAAFRLAERPATDRHSYGLQRAEVLAAQANGVLLLGASVVIVVEAIGRLGRGHHFDGWPTLGIALAGLAANVVSAALVARHAGRSLNLRAAMAHLAADAATSVAVVVAAGAMLVWGATWPDPVISLLIALVVVWTAWVLLRDTTHVLLEGTPHHLDPHDVTAALVADPAVEEVHHLHLWDLASDTTALSAHVVLGGELTLHDAQRHADRLKRLLEERFGVAHATLEVECHPCEPTSSEIGPHGSVH